jgi:hypothetical protein
MDDSQPFTQELQMDLQSESAIVLQPDEDTRNTPTVGV